MFNPIEKHDWTATATDKSDWIVLDLETGNAPEEFIEQKIAEWTPPGNISKPETIAAKREEAKQKIREKSALLDAAPILCVAVNTPQQKMIFNGMDDKQHSIEGWEVQSFGDESRMLLGLRQWLDSGTDPYTTLVGHNVCGFDLPKLRSANIRHRLMLPHCLRIGGDEYQQKTADTMKIYARKFAVEGNGQPFVTLDRVAAAFGLPRPKLNISGSDVPAMHERGEHLAILTYCAIDAATTAAAWELMTSTSANLT